MSKALILTKGTFCEIGVGNVVQFGIFEQTPFPAFPLLQRRHIRTVKQFMTGWKTAFMSSGFLNPFEYFPDDQDIVHY